MENLLSLKKVDDVSYQLFSKINSKLIGNIMIEVDVQSYRGTVGGKRFNVCNRTLKKFARSGDKIYFR